MRWFCWLFVLLINPAYCSPSEADAPLFVSLGCTSRVSTYLRQAGIHYQSPFSLLLTTDSKGMIALLEDDFAYFLDKRYLVQDPHFNGITYRVVNRYYNIDFRHDWHDIDDNFEVDLPRIQEKYHKLITSFRELADYKGKVYFIRMAYPGDWVNPNYFEPAPDNDCFIISYAQAAAIKKALEQKFPKLDFNLVIINHIENSTRDIVNLNKVVEFKVRKLYPFDDFVNICKQLEN